MISLVKAANSKACGHKYTNSCYSREGLSAGCNMAAVVDVIPGAELITVQRSGERTEGLTAWPLNLLIGLLPLNSEYPIIRTETIKHNGSKNPVVKTKT